MGLVESTRQAHNGDMTGGAVLADRNQTADRLETEGAGVLMIGDEFELKLNDIEGASWKAFVFHGHTTHPSGNEWVSVFGGDPIKKDHEHRRQWHAFDVDKVRQGARPIRPTWSAKNGKSFR